MYLHHLMISTTLTISKSPVFTFCQNCTFSAGLITIAPTAWPVEGSSRNFFLKKITWFLDHKKTSAFISKIFVWLSLGIDLSLKGVLGTIPTGDRKWKLVPERVKLQAALGSSAKERMAQIFDVWNVTTEHILGTHGSWLTRCCSACS